jgi:hypothetical protein
VIASRVTLANPAVVRLGHAPHALSALYSIAVREATTLAFADAFLALAGVTLLLTPLVFLLKTRKLHGPIELPAE